MNLAARMSKLYPEGAYAVLSQAQRLEQQGKSIIHLEIGQPDFPTPENITRSGIYAIKQGKTKYTSPLGILPLRKKIAEYITHTRGVHTTSSRIAVTPSGKTALFAAIASTVERGDEVMVPDPGFPTYKTVAEFFGGGVRSMPLLEHNQFRIDIKKFKKTFSKRTKLIILNSPSNPTGGILSKSDLSEIADMVQGSKTWILSDEIYEKFLYDAPEYHSIYSLPTMKERTIIINGFSKTYCMTGWRLGYMVIPEKIIDKVDYFLTHSVGCTAAFTQEAGIEALIGSQVSVKRMIDEFRKRRNFVVSQLDAIPGVRCQNPGGAFYAFPNVTSFKKSSKKIALYLLEKAGVALLSGSDFGKFGEGYLRISYASSLTTLKEGLHRIRNGLAKL